MLRECPPRHDLPGIRIGAEALAGASLLVGLPMGAFLLASGCGLDCAVGLILVGGLVGLTFAPLGVFGLGRALQGQGGLGSTFVGWSIGIVAAALAIGGAYLVGVLSPPGYVLLGVAAVSPLVGALVGFELSHGAAKAETLRSKEPYFVPSLLETLPFFHPT